ncbi:MAG: peptidylprolyl isomerase [Hyphomicrobiales bacterium]|nr:peptidylprolyl isomerase [Hyphomicrobiales bacterium]MCP4999413.1 peptidylprolyl isomerase [Hyphomicrobiales bacterium]
MATLYQNPSLQIDGESYSTYQEPDRSVPPKAKPVTKEISVNGIAISETELLAEAQNHPADNPGGALAEAARALVVRELLWQEARRLELAVLPENDADGRLETERDAAIRALIDRQVDVPTAGEEECRRYYDQNPEKLSSEPLIEARHILLASVPGDKTARIKSKALARQLSNHLSDQPQEFAALAKQHSACPSREHGGNLGQLTRGSTVPEFERAIEAMKEGEISTVPVESRFGFHVIALDRKVPGEKLPFDLVRERIAVWLEAAAWSKAVSQYIAILAGAAEIKGISLNTGDGPLVQ